MADTIIVIGIATILFISMFAFPIFVWKVVTSKKPEKNYPFRKSAIYTNRMGHLVKTDPDPYLLNQIKKYFEHNPEHKKDFIDGLHDEEVW